MPRQAEELVRQRADAEAARAEAAALRGEVERLKAAVAKAEDAAAAAKKQEPAKPQPSNDAELKELRAKLKATEDKLAAGVLCFGWLRGL